MSQEFDKFNQEFIEKWAPKTNYYSTCNIKTLSECDNKASAVRMLFSMYDATLIREYIKQRTPEKLANVKEFVQYKNDVFLFDRVPEDIWNQEKNPFLVNYKDIVLPKRSTEWSAGYDFTLPLYSDAHITLHKRESIKIPTGVNVILSKNLVLSVYPRSGLGFKYRVQLANTVGIIDADYFYSDNGGHIYIKLFNNGDKDIELKGGDKFAQGICTQYFITNDDDADGVRNGGMNSTGMTFTSK